MRQSLGRAPKTPFWGVFEYWAEVAYRKIGLHSLGGASPLHAGLSALETGLKSGCFKSHPTNKGQGAHQPHSPARPNSEA
jgi:hypothetical protein